METPNGVESASRTGRAHDEEQEHGGPPEGHADVHRHADRCSGGTAVERVGTEQRSRDALEQTLDRRVIERDAQHTREQPVDDGGQQSRAHEP
jgi:hypothetical protein